MPATSTCTIASGWVSITSSGIRHGCRRVYILDDIIVVLVLERLLEVIPRISSTHSEFERVEMMEINSSFSDGKRMDE